MTQENHPQSTAKRPFDDERKFIHDLATPTTTIQLLAETSMEILNKLAQENPQLADALRKEAERLKKILDSAQKLTAKLHDRRNLLIAASSPDDEIK